MSANTWTPADTAGAPACTGRAGARTPDSPARRRAAEPGHPLWFLLPAFAVLVVFFFVPTLFNFIYAFTDWSGFKSAINPVGFDNFVNLPQQRHPAQRAADHPRLRGPGGGLPEPVRPRPGRAAGGGTPGSTGSPARLLHPGADVGPRRRLHLPGAAQARGRLNAAARRSSPGRTSTTPGWATPPGRSSVVALIHAWKWMGLSMLIYLAGLKTIREDVLEAARIDGASPLADLLAHPVRRCSRRRSPSTSRPPCSAR